MCTGKINAPKPGQSTGTTLSWSAVTVSRLPWSNGGGLIKMDSSPAAGTLEIAKPVRGEIVLNSWHAHICQECGYLSVLPTEHGIAITYPMNTHFYRSPKCWEGYQTRLKGLYESQLDQESYRRFVTFIVCYTCDRQVFHYKEDRRPLRCAYCVGDQIRRNRRKIATVINCDCCGKQFLPKRKDTRFCSSACRQKAYRRRHVTDRREQT